MFYIIVDKLNFLDTNCSIVRVTGQKIIALQVNKINIQEILYVGIRSFLFIFANSIRQVSSYVYVVMKHPIYNDRYSTDIERN